MRLLMGEIGGVGPLRPMKGAGYGQGGASALGR